MSSKPQAKAGPREAADAARPVPGTDAAAAAVASAQDDDEDERETLRAPPRRQNDTPTRVPMLVEGAATGGMHDDATLADSADTERIRDDEDTRPVPLEGHFVGGREIHIPPLPMPKDMAKLLELEGGASATARAPAPELRPPTFVSTLSPAERATRKQEPRRGRVLAGLAIAAVGALAIGVSAWWQPVAEPIVPKRAAAVARVELAPSPAPTSTPTSTSSSARPAADEPQAVATAVEPGRQLKLVPVPRPAGAGARKRAKVGPAIDPSTLPETPSRQAVIDAMAPLREEIARCAEGRGGVAELMLSVGGSGAVLHAAIVGDYSGTPQGSCIALAARKAHFAPFQQERFSVRYPVAL